MENKFNFTKKDIDALSTPAPGKRDSYHDTNKKGYGLQLRVTSTGLKTFSVFRRINGSSPERITIGRFPDMTVEQARREAARIAGDIANGKNPAEVKRGTRAEIIFNDLFAEYMERHSKLHKKTWHEDQEKYDNHIAKRLGKKKLSMIDRAMISALHSDITKAGYPIAANRILALISSIYGWAISAGLWQSNPALGIRRNKENERDRFIQGDELPRFFKALAEEENQTIRDYLLVALLTGARSTNVKSMRWENINFDRAEWRIEETKNGTSQVVTLSPECLEVLQNRKPVGNAEFVFPGNGKTGFLQEPKKGWKRVLDRAQIKNLRIHDLRRTLGSWQAKEGASLVIIGKSLNHKNQATTAIYARLDQNPVRDSVNRATSAIMAAAGLKNDADITPIRKNK